MPEHTGATGTASRIFISGLLIALIALSWSGVLEKPARAGTEATLTRALATYAIARGLNGVISVAQGTEIAIQPVGVGVTITAGEILDPLNDLVERFSWLVLVACASLGTQLLMTELLANAWISGVMTVALLAYLASLWTPGTFVGRNALLRACAVLVFTRFLFTAVTLVSGWIDEALLEDRQAEAVSQITLTKAEIENLQHDHAPIEDDTASLLDRFGDLLDEQRQALDLSARLQSMTERVEQAIEDLVSLMVLFVVQTIIIPVAALAAAWTGCRWFWASTWKPRGPGT